MKDNGEYDSKVDDKMEKKEVKNRIDHEILRVETHGFFVVKKPP